MPFEWDQEKSAATKANRGIDFTFASRAWADEGGIDIPATTEGEPRFLRFAKIESKCYAIVFTVRGENIRIISARRARPNEEAIRG